MVGRLSKKRVEGTAPSSRDVRIWDGELPGFGCKITPQGRRIYILRYRAGDRQRWYTIGPHGAPWTPETARREALRLLGLIAQGADPAAGRQANRKAVTVRALCDLYLAEGCATKKASTLATDRGRIARHIVPLLGARRAADVTRADIERFLQEVAAGRTKTDVRTGIRGRAIVEGGRGTASRTVGLLGGIFSFAVARGIRADNPIHGVRRFADRKRDRFLTAGELARLGRILDEVEREGGNPFVTAAVRLLVLTGARKSEILLARWSWFDPENAVLRLPDSKTGARVLHLGEAAADLLRALPRIEGNPFILPGSIPEKPLGGFQKAWERIRTRAGLEDVRLHDLRHSFASVAASSGDSLLVIGALLGHRDAASTARYAHLQAAPLKLAADRTSKSIAAAMQRPDRGKGES